MGFLRVEGAAPGCELVRCVSDQSEQNLTDEKQHSDRLGLSWPVRESLVGNPSLF